MRQISEVAHQQLVWAQPSRIQQAFELRDANEIYGTLHFERGSLAAGDTSNQHWTFKRQGFWHPQVTIRIPGSDSNWALFKPSWSGGGALELPDGRILKFGAANFWHSQWDWQDQTGQPLVHFKGHAGILKMEGEVDIEASARTIDVLDLLVVLGWYLLILFARDAAAASAGSTAAIISST